MNVNRADGSSLLSRWPWLLGAFVVGGFAGLGAVGLGALVVIEGGLFDATATKPHNVLVSWATHAAFQHSVRVRAAKIEAPAQFTQAQVDDGFSQYDTSCVMCHGAPGVSRAHFVRGMTPTPPFVLDAQRRWTPGQLFWILQRGVKMTAMPAWGETRSTAQVWDLVAFLEVLPSVSPQAYAQMRAAHANAAPPSPSPAG